MPKTLKEKIKKILEKFHAINDENYYSKLANEILSLIETSQKSELERIRKLKKKCDIIDYENKKPIKEFFCQTYNRAIDDILQLFNEPKI